eukprot:1104859-Pleurochrysis_carterae.AAC.1
MACATASCGSASARLKNAKTTGSCSRALSVGAKAERQSATPCRGLQLSSSLDASSSLSAAITSRRPLWFCSFGGGGKFDLYVSKSFVNVVCSRLDPAAAAAASASAACMRT